MAEDKRIIKTKKLLKLTLVDLLKEQSFERLTVKLICDRSQVSRITFYNHYSDKYDLVDSLFIDMVEIARTDYYELQNQNNPNRDAIKNYLNLLECILNLFYEENAFLRYAVPGKSPYLHSAFYKHITENLEMYMNKRNRIIKPRYSPQKISGFLANGLWSFITQSHVEGCSRDVIYKETSELLLGILNSKTLFS